MPMFGQEVVPPQPVAVSVRAEVAGLSGTRPLVAAGRRAAALVCDRVVYRCSSGRVGLGEDPLVSPRGFSPRAVLRGELFSWNAEYDLELAEPHPQVRDGLCREPLNGGGRAWPAGAGPLLRGCSGQARVIGERAVPRPLSVIPPCAMGGCPL